MFMRREGSAHPEPHPSARVARCGASLRLSKIAPGDFVEPVSPLRGSTALIHTATTNKQEGRARRPSCLLVEAAGLEPGAERSL